MVPSVGFKKVVLLMGDTAALVAALVIAIAIRYPARFPEADIVRLHIVPFGALFFLWLLVFYIYNLYDLRHVENSVTFFSMALQAFVLNALVAIAFFYFNPYASITPRTVLFVDLVFSALFFGAWRAVFNRTLATKLATRTALIGTSAPMLALARELEEHPALGYRISCFVTDAPFVLPQYLAHIPVVASAALQHLNTDAGSISLPPIDSIVLDKNPNQAPERALALFALIGTKVSFHTLPAFIEQVFQKIPLSQISQSWFF